MHTQVSSNSISLTAETENKFNITKKYFQNKLNIKSTLNTCVYSQKIKEHAYYHLNNDSILHRRLIQLPLNNVASSRGTRFDTELSPRSFLCLAVNILLILSEKNDLSVDFKHTHRRNINGHTNKFSFVQKLIRIWLKELMFQQPLMVSAFM